MKQKNKKKFNFININLIIITISLIVSLIIINYFSKQSERILFPLAKERITKVISSVINHATDNLEHTKNLYSLDINNEEIKMVNYNNREVVKLLDDLTFKIEKDLKNLEEENNEEKIPFGIIFNNIMLSNLGPKIKIKFHFLGSIVSKVETEIKPYGINNAYIEMRVNVSVNGQIILPFVSERVTIDNVIPVSISIVSGKVPEGYITSYK